VEAQGLGKRPFYSAMTLAEREEKVNRISGLRAGAMGGRRAVFFRPLRDWRLDSLLSP